MSSFEDDEPPPENLSAGARLSMNAERVRLVAHSNDEAPLEENRQRVLLQLTDTTSSTAERSGLDLVAVLDVSGSMGENENWKLEKLKTAMKFVISKLGAMDRLSIVSFSTKANRLCPLRSMTEASKAELTDMVETRLKASGATNMKDGLETGLKVLHGRQLKSDRVASVILMSDGQQNEGEDARNVAVGDVAVYTFGFGADQDAEVLEAIAGNSLGGTFYDVEEGQNLSEHFSALLAGLLTVVVQDLKLTVREEPGHSKILGKDRVDAGGYPTKTGRDAGSFVVDFGYLYGGEVRNVIVDLLLPTVSRAYRAPVLTARCTYSIKGRTFYSPQDRYLSCSISRTGGSASARVLENEEVKVELIRRRHASKLGEAIATNDVDRARGKLEEAETALRAERSRHPLIELLKAELAKLLTLTTWKKLVACLRAAKRSHDVQRFASRGDVGVPIFKPRRMLEYVDQARKFDEDPSRPPPSVEEDERRVAFEADDRHRPQEQRPASRVWAGSPRARLRSSGWAWATVLLCTALAVGVIVAGVAVFAVYLFYTPSMPYLAISDASLERLQYDPVGAIDYLQASITVMAVNNNSNADASFSRMDLVLRFHGADVALLQAQPFVVPQESSLTLPYNVVSAGRPLDSAGMQAMENALKAGVVPLDLFGKARTRWKVGVFANLRFWTRISCRLHFFFPGNGTVMPTDRDKCRSK